MVVLSELSPTSRYFFRIYATNSHGQQTVSDILTFVTSSKSARVNLSLKNISIFSNKLLLSSDSIDTVIALKSSYLTVTLKLGAYKDLKNLAFYFQKKSDTTHLELATQHTFIEILPGILTTEILTPSHDGEHFLILKIKTASGGFLTIKTPYTFFITNPIKIVDKNNHEPIEGAVVGISKFQEGYGRYESLDEIFSFITKTNYDGQLHFTLPTGMYSFKVTAIGYKTLTFTKTIDTNTQNYPTIEMEQNSSILEGVKYYFFSVKDVLFGSLSRLSEFGHSPAAESSFVVFLTFADLFSLLFLLTSAKNVLTFTFKSWIFHLSSIWYILLVWFINTIVTVVFSLNQGVINTVPVIIFEVTNTIIVYRALKQFWLYHGKRLP